jgi:hypothetical protein
LGWLDGWADRDLRLMIEGFRMRPVPDLVPASSPPGGVELARCRQPIGRGPQPPETHPTHPFTSEGGGSENQGTASPNLASPTFMPEQSPYAGEIVLPVLILRVSHGCITHALVSG